MWWALQHFILDSGRCNCDTGQEGLAANPSMKQQLKSSKCNTYHQAGWPAVGRSLAPDQRIFWAEPENMQKSITTLQFLVCRKMPNAFSYSMQSDWLVCNILGWGMWKCQSWQLPRIVRERCAVHLWHQWQRHNFMTHHHSDTYTFVFLHDMPDFTEKYISITRSLGALWAPTSGLSNEHWADERQPW